jgi:hypothetical protein
MSLTIIKGQTASVKSKRFELQSIEDCLKFYNEERKYTESNRFINFPESLISALANAIENRLTFRYKKFIKTFIPSFLKPNVKSSTQLDFWINRGYDVDQARLKIANIQSKFAKKFAEKRKINPNNYSGILPTQIEYWEAKGLSAEDAKIEVSNRQKTFSLEKCIRLYGKVDGLKKFNERQEKWQNSLLSSKDVTWKTSQRSLSFSQYEKRYGKKWISIYINHLSNKSKNTKYINDLSKIEAIMNESGSNILTYIKSLNSFDIFRFSRNPIIRYLTKKNNFELVSEWMISNNVSMIESAKYGTRYYQNGKYYQSTAEFRLGEKLNELGIDFELHKRYPGTRYYSDFYVPKISTYIEYMGMQANRYEKKKYELSKSEFVIIWSNSIDKILNLINEEIHKNN